VGRASIGQCSVHQMVPIGSPVEEMRVGDRESPGEP